MSSPTEHEVKQASARDVQGIESAAVQVEQAAGFVLNQQRDVPPQAIARRPAPASKRQQPAVSVSGSIKREVGMGPSRQISSENAICRDLVEAREAWAASHAFCAGHQHGSFL